MHVVVEKSMMEKQELHRNETVFKGVFRTQSKICNGAFMRKQLKICNRELFPWKSSIIDVRVGLNTSLSLGSFSSKF